MQLLKPLNSHDSAGANRDLRVLVCCAEVQSAVARHLKDFGTQVEIIAEVFTALAEVIDDPAGTSVLVLNCDTPGIDGLAGGHRAVRMMGEVQGRIPVILIAKDCPQQRFPIDRLAPVELRAPVTALSLRAAFDHALRDRLAYLAG
jgi:hypothetical protein